MPRKEPHLLLAGWVSEEAAGTRPGFYLRDCVGAGGGGDFKDTFEGARPTPTPALANALHVQIKRDPQVPEK